MRLHRLRLKDFRGVAEREVVFADNGVTVIEGENEAGKSTMVEALDLLLTVRDKSSKAAVRAVQPSGQDVGSEVTAEISCGPYRFEYFKRFNKSPQTTLTVLEPTPEQITGRAAHERVEQILDASLDRTLYGALSLVQSADPELGALTDSAALSRALDRAAGSAQDDKAAGDAGESPQTHDLLAAVTREYQRYFTAAQGRPTGELLQAQQQAAAAAEAVAERRRILASVQEATERLPQVAATIAELAELESEQRVEASRAAAEAAQADAVAEKLTAALAVVEQRAMAAKVAGDAVTARAALRTRLGQHQSEEAAGVEAVSAATADAVAAAERAARAGAELDVARAELAGVQERIEQAEAAEAVAADRRRRDELDETITEARRVEGELASAHAEDASLTVSDADASEAVTLDRAIAAAEARLESGAATVVVTPLGDDVTVDGQTVTGEHTAAVAAETVVETPSVRVRVVPGADAQVSADELAQLRARRAALLERCGVTELADVAPAAGRKARAQAQVKDLTVALTRILRGRTVDELTAARAEVDARIPAEAPTQAADLRELRESERHASREVARLERARDGELAAEREAQNKAQAWEVSGQRAAQAAKALREEIALAVAEASDSQLTEAETAAGAALESAQLAAASLRAEAARADIEGVRARCADAEAALERTRHRLDAQRTLQTELTTRLEMCRSDGRFGELSDAEADAEAARATLDRVAERADGARVLYETLQRKRSDARARYVAPFARRLEELAAPVFGEGVRFHVDDDFVIRTRTLDGVTVDVASLSGGAREQVGLLARLACASLIDEADGVPVILDDALGYSDPDRLASMARVLGRAAGNAQIIVLTCTPERYGAVEDATRVAV